MWVFLPRWWKVACTVQVWHHNSGHCNISFQLMILMMLIMIRNKMIKQGCMACTCSVWLCVSGDKVLYNLPSKDNVCVVMHLLELLMIYVQVSPPLLKKICWPEIAYWSFKIYGPYKLCRSHTCFNHPTTYFQPGIHFQWSSMLSWCLDMPNLLVSVHGRCIHTQKNLVPSIHPTDVTWTCMTKNWRIVKPLDIPLITRVQKRCWAETLWL